MGARAISVPRLTASAASPAFLVGMAVAFVVVLVLALAPPALAGEAYYRGNDIPLDNPDWMAGFPDDLLLSQLSLPGTHDTMARDTGDPLATCQDATLADQLQAGIRVLDIRCANDYSSTLGHYFSIWHGPLYRLGTFDEVADECKTFLAAHSGETIIMRIKQELTLMNPKVTQSFTDTFKDYRDDKYPGLFADIGDGRHIPTLGAVRGKVVVLQDYDYSPFWGIRYITPGSNPPFDSQDNYVVAFSKAGFESKWAGIYRHLYATNAGNRTTTWYVNYLSGGTETYPERVAGGYSNGFSAAGMNDRMLTRLRSSAPLDPPSGSGAAPVSLTGAGTVFMDFPGPGLIQAIIDLNGGTPTGFPDVPASHPYHDAIEGMAGQGIIGGYLNGNFGPEDPVIRQQFAKMIVLTLGLPVAGERLAQSCGALCRSGGGRPGQALPSRIRSRLCS